MPFLSSITPWLPCNCVRQIFDLHAYLANCSSVIFGGKNNTNEMFEADFSRCSVTRMQRGNMNISLIGFEPGNRLI